MRNFIRRYAIVKPRTPGLPWVSLKYATRLLPLPSAPPLLDNIRSNYVNRLDNVAVISVSYYINRMNGSKRTCTIYAKPGNNIIHIALQNIYYFNSFKRRVSFSLRSGPTYDYANEHFLCRVIVIYSYQWRYNYSTQLSSN